MTRLRTSPVTCWNDRVPGGLVAARVSPAWREERPFTFESARAIPISKSKIETSANKVKMKIHQWRMQDAPPDSVAIIT